MPRDAHLRIGRPSRDLERVARMYRKGLGFEELGSFRDHDGFDGVMLGHPGHGYHIELTSGSGAPESPSPDQLLVFYIPHSAEWASACDRMLEAGFTSVVSHNPYWDARGRTFEDPDGYRVVLQNAEWPA